MDEISHQWEISHRLRTPGLEFYTKSTKYSHRRHFCAFPIFFRLVTIVVQLRLTSGSLLVHSMQRILGLAGGKLGGVEFVVYFPHGKIR